jgi:hypothetical protein
MFVGSPSYQIGPSLVFSTLATRLSAQALNIIHHKKSLIWVMRWHPAGEYSQKLPVSPT